MSAFIVTIFILCSFANSRSSGTLDIVPSSFIISQITPAGVRPARRARSTDPSVCPALFSTPPFLALSGNMCPGRARSSGMHFGLTAVRMVVALSAADMPVVTPFLASMDTVKPVPNDEVFLVAIIGS